MTRKKEDNISPLQKETLAEVCRFVDIKGYPPTVKELAGIIGISHASIHDRLNQLIRKGFLKREGRKARGLTVTNKPVEMAVTLVAVAIVGEVAAGYPVMAEENIIGEVLVEASTVRSGKCFALYARGESMVKAGINNGDLIIVRRQPIAEDGDIVVALLNGEATVKRLRIRQEVIELVPENPSFSPIPVEPEDELLILGMVVGCKSSEMRH